MVISINEMAYERHSNILYHKVEGGTRWHLISRLPLNPTALSGICIAENFTVVLCAPTRRFIYEKAESAPMPAN